MAEEGGAGGRKQKLDPSGVPLTVRQRGGKRQKKDDLRAQEVESGARVRDPKST